ncbi:hypothetical protein DCAR_0831626 [Daucus carota subsp. sativus]|uniref:Uncharacterized protein n=1 Tax=Daucus carota subsp. sativus TaxID=79200 RepID=A0AAF1BCJ7_DAUCS|nr:hypothetical protein DCAR_0831626 [Daucus carota subsp. sativus]
MKRHRVILNGDKKNNYRGFLDNKIFDSNKSFSRSCDKRIAQVIGASSDGEFVLQPTNDIQKTLTAIYKFSRPYTFIGIITAISSVSLLPLTSLGDLSPAVFVGFLKINKPYLPLVSGELSMGQGKAIVSACGFMDIPDVEGDEAFGNPTFSVKYGKKKVFSLCLVILLSAYGSAIVIGASSSFLICKLVSVSCFG